MKADQRVLRRLEGLFAVPRVATSLGAELDVYSGFETRTPADRYRWDGLRRGGSARTPYVVLQYTLDGAGAFLTEGRSHRLTPGWAFAAVIPSRHVYLLPEDSPSWRFVWLIVRHPYLVSRVAALSPPAGPVLRAPIEGELVQAILELITSTRDPSDDRFSRERRLFDLLLAIERSAWLMHHPDDRREQLLQRVRAIVQSQSSARLNVDAIAGAFDMTRSNFSHHFRAVTGLSPAAFVRDLRLQQARQMLTQGEETTKAIALRTGFADATHLGKAFRQRFGFTPAEFRRQVAVPWRATATTPGPPSQARPRHPGAPD